MLPEFDAVMSANMVMMMRADVDGAIWLVDDEDEGRFYEGAAHERGRVIPAFGAALNVLRIVIDRGVHGVVGITRGPAQDVGTLPLYRPDIGDVASMLLTSRGADRVLGEVGGAAWLTACGREIGGILSRAVRIARAVERLSGGRRSSDDVLPQLVNWDAADINWQFVDCGGLGSSVAVEQITSARRIESTDRLENDLLDCDGMSAVGVLAAATLYYRPRGIPAYRGVSTKELISLLRTGFELEEIEKEGVYWRLKEWQWRNGRYALFRQWRKLEPFNILLEQRYLQTDVTHLTASGLEFAAIQLDLDNFKNVNDQLGHIEGDEAIILAERIVLLAMEGRGEAYRRGGDELAGVVVGVTYIEAVAFAEHLRQEIESQFQEWARLRNLSPAPTASIGVAHVARMCVPSEVLQRLEAAQMEAKKGGKNKVVSVQCA